MPRWSGALCTKRASIRLGISYKSRDTTPDHPPSSLHSCSSSFALTMQFNHLIYLAILGATTLVAAAPAPGHTAITITVHEGPQLHGENGNIKVTGTGTGNQGGLTVERYNSCQDFLDCGGGWFACDNRNHLCIGARRVVFARTVSLAIQTGYVYDWKKELDFEFALVALDKCYELVSN
ncbi:hypothetical protein FB451DRAFT_1432376 [Mycena latifolia]|nr:hypothetical protein FB451DRAFT_1432376 [Mycena latifolia]